MSHIYILFLLNQIQNVDKFHVYDTLNISGRTRCHGSTPKSIVSHDLQQLNDGISSDTVSKERLGDTSKCNLINHRPSKEICSIISSDLFHLSCNQLSNENLLFRLIKIFVKV